MPFFGKKQPATLEQDFAYYHFLRQARNEKKSFFFPQVQRVKVVYILIAMRNLR